MGLTSLPYLNKIHNFNYWNNVWDSKLLFKKYLLLSFFLNKYLNLIFSDYSINALMRFLSLKRVKKGFKLKKSFFTINVFRKYFLGKIVILKYQKWYLIILKIFNLKVKKKRFKLRKGKKKKKKIFFSKKLNLNYIYSNYKYYL